MTNNTSPATAPRVPKRVAAVVINSLKGGVVPRIGLPYITVGRAAEIDALLRDVERDRQHPTKCRRPIASGAVPVSCAVAEEVILFGILIVLSQLGQFPLKSWLCMGTYFVLNLGYSFGWKNVPILDIAILVSGFLLRMLLGTSVTGIAISGWLYLTVTSVSFYMGLGKRRGELRTVSKSSRKVLQYYSDSFLTQNMQMCLTLTVVFYSLWSMDRGENLMWTVPLVICICLKYGLTVDGNSDGDPVEIIYQDKALMALGVVFAVITLALLYL